MKANIAVVLLSIYLCFGTYNQYLMRIELNEKCSLTYVKGHHMVKCGKSYFVASNK